MGDTANSLNAVPGRNSGFRKKSTWAEDREHAIWICGNLEIAYFAPPNLIEAAEKLPMFRKALNTGKEVVPLDRVEKAIIVLDVVVLELDEQIGIAKFLGHQLTLTCAADRIRHLRSSRNSFGVLHKDLVE